MEQVITRRELIAGSVAAALGRAAHAAAPVQEYRRGGMAYRRLGQTNIHVSLLGFGSHTDPQYKRKTKWGSVLTEEGQARRDRQIARAFDLGVNLVDTYENCGQWEPFARQVKERRDKVLVSICRQFPMFVGENIDRAAKLYGHVDLYRIYVGDGDSVDGPILEEWDVMRKAREAGKVRAIGIATHSERMMLAALRELEGLDYVLFPYNFIHARADYSQFLPAAIRQGIGLIAIKPMAAGSIMNLDPRAQPNASRPESEKFQLYQAKYRPLLPAVVTELTKSLERLPEETLCQAAARFVYSRPFIACALAGMFDDQWVEDNYAALARQMKMSREETAALGAARTLAEATRKAWLPPHYRWLDERWRA
jgi:aryl-alcohol dehydrogenase-like predicted oxidoreductase